MSDFQKQHPESAALLKRLGSQPSAPVPEPTTDPTPTGYKGILLIVWLLAILFVAVPFLARIGGEPDGRPCLTCVKIP